MSIQNYYREKENCYTDIRQAREVFGNKNSTQTHYDAVDRSLGLAYLYCPEEIKDIVYATLLESTRRQMLLLLK